MPYRLKVALLVVRDEHGKLWHHYQSPGPGASRGPYIPWLNDEQREHFLRKGLVEEIVDGAAPVVEAAQPAAAPVAVAEPYTAPRIAQGDVAPSPDVVNECIKALDGLRNADGPVVPTSAGAPTARVALREAGFSFSNEAISLAVKHRKMRSR